MPNASPGVRWWKSIRKRRSLQSSWQEAYLMDHKDKDEQGDFPTRLVIPTAKFTAMFSKNCYRGIKRVLDEHGVNYTKYTITQSLGFEQKLENLDLRRDNAMMMSLDIINMYPSIWVKLIKKALQYYSCSLPAEAKQGINLGLAMVKFGIKSMLVNVSDKFYAYQGAAKGQDLLEEDVVLTISAFESAFLADLVVSFVIEKWWYVSNQRSFKKCINMVD
eukprot:2065884-Ditylum_brightwellii.AAC.1